MLKEMCSGVKLVRGGCVVANICQVAWIFESPTRHISEHVC